MTQHREIPAGSPIPPEQRKWANSLAQAIEAVLKPLGFNFCLLLFPKNEPGRVNYISDCTRESSTVALRQILARWEGRYHEGEPEKKQ